MSKKFDTSDIYNLNPSKLKVLIGITPSIDSCVAAYLLKKQGFQVAALALQTWSDGKNKRTYVAVDGSESVVKLNHPRCHTEDLDPIKKFCESLNIPFYVTDISEEYYDSIVEKSISEKITGQFFPTCYNCNKLRMRVLKDKMDKLGFDFISTAHYAKVYKSHTTGEFFIYKGNEVDKDQSHQLSAVDKDCLPYLILPLSDLKRDEVLKIANNFEISTEEARAEKTIFKYCLIQDENYAKYVEACVPRIVHMAGELEDYSTGKGLGEHSGLHQYGEQQEIKFKENSNDKYHVVEIDPHHKLVKISKNQFKYKKIELKNFYVSYEIDKSRPIELYFKFINLNRIIKGDCFFKVGQNAIVHLKEEVEEIPANSVVVAYSDETNNARVMGQGLVSHKGFQGYLDRCEVYEDAEKIKKDDDDDDQEKDIFTRF